MLISHFELILLLMAVAVCAEKLHASGVLSTVACGIVMGWRQHALLPATVRVETRAVWGTVTFTLESLIFILKGFSLKAALPQLFSSETAVQDFALQSGVVVAAVVMSRFAWILPTVYVIRAIFPALRRRDPYPPLGIPILLSWAGMRGVVSLAAALALPDRFPGRDFILATTFTVILVTVVVQGSTLAPLIRLLRLRERPGMFRAPMSEREARLMMTIAELETVKRQSAQSDGAERHPRLVEQYTYRIAAMKRSAASKGALDYVRDDHFTAVLAGIAAGRGELLRLHRTGEIDDATLHVLERELDSNKILAGQRRGQTVGG